MGSVLPEMRQDMPMTNQALGLFISFDKSTQTLAVVERSGSAERTLLTYRLDGRAESEASAVEQTLGQLVLHSLDRMTPGGLGFGDYANLFEQISEDNFVAFCSGLDLALADDQYAQATMMFSRGKRVGSWGMIEEAIELFKRAATSGHAEAKHFLDEDLPVVLPRLKQKLQPG